MQATESGFPKWKKIAGPLKAGQKAAARVPRGKNCKVDLHGTFADGQSLDAEGVEVCANKTLNLKCSFPSHSRRPPAKYPERSASPYFWPNSSATYSQLTR